MEKSIGRLTSEYYYIIFVSEYAIEKCMTINLPNIGK